MKIKCGTDIIEISRIQDSINSLQNKFVEKVFTKKEIAYCESKNKQKYQHYAARFAAKEATFKAVSESLNDKYDISWQDIEVTNDQNGRPKLAINNVNMDNIEGIDLSISHCKDYASANVVILYK